MSGANNNDDTSAINKSQVYDVHEGIIFIVELTDTLLIPQPDSGYSNLQIILEAINKAMTHSIITLPNTGYGLYFFNGQISTDESKLGVERLFALNDLNYKDMKKLYNIIEENIPQSGNRNTKPYVPLSERFKPSLDATSDNPLDDVLRLAQEDFLTKKEFQKDYNNKKIFLFTDNDEPLSKENLQQKSILRNTCNDLDDCLITITPFFISSKFKPFDEQLYSEIMFLNNKVAEGDDDVGEDSIFDGPNTKPIDVEFIEERIIRRKEIKRKQFEVPLIFSDNLVVGVKGYSVYGHETPKPTKKIYETTKFRKNVYPRTRYVNPKTGEEYEKVTHVYKVGSGEDDIIQMSAEQMKEIGAYNDKYETFFTLLGFKDESSGIKLHYNVSPSVFVTPDEESFNGSTRTLSALYKSLLKQKKVAILFGKSRKLSQPAIYALQASLKPLSPEGFFLIRLPFLDDIRKFPPLGEYNDIYEPDPQLTKITKLILSNLKLKHGYKPSEFKNPSLQQHFRVLHDYLLQVEQVPEEEIQDKIEEKLSKDDTLRKIHQVRQLVNDSQLEGKTRIHEYIKEWNKLYADD